jgi:predicted HicB family RNase H-like nuclease
MYAYIHLRGAVVEGVLMAASESRLKANKKYHEKFDNLQIRVPGGEKEIISGHAAAMGESLNSFVRRAISEAMERDQAKTSTDKAE